MTANRKVYERLSQQQTFTVMKMVEENGSKDGKLWVYNSGWDDARIAKEAGCDELSVTYRRRKVFGNIRRRQHGASDDHFEMKKRIEALEKTINILLTAPVKEGISPERLAELIKHFGSVRT